MFVNGSGPMEKALLPRFSSLGEERERCNDDRAASHAQVRIAGPLARMASCRQRSQRAGDRYAYTRTMPASGAPATPSLIVASSSRHSDNFQTVVEEIL